jgi:uncharacterized protein (DUF111 family)
VLCKRSRLTALQELVFEHTTTIGMRVMELEKVALERRFEAVHVEGESVAVKIAGRAGRILNVSIEYADVAAIAQQHNRSERDVLHLAETAAAAAGYRIGGVFEAD